MGPDRAFLGDFQTLKASRVLKMVSNPIRSENYMIKRKIIAADFFRKVDIFRKNTCDFSKADFDIFRKNTCNFSNGQHLKNAPPPPKMKKNENSRFPVKHTFFPKKFTY